MSPKRRKNIEVKGLYKEGDKKAPKNFNLKILVWHHAKVKETGR
jgi:hypothetical protein